MYIQNAAQWYNLNQYHVNKFLIRIKQTKNHILNIFHIQETVKSRE